jgi:hypothetical protein
MFLFLLILSLVDVSFPFDPFYFHRIGSQRCSILFLYLERFFPLILEISFTNYFVPCYLFIFPVKFFVPGRIAFCFFIHRDLFILF